MGYLVFFPLCRSLAGDLRAMFDSMHPLPHPLFFSAMVITSFLLK